MATPAPLARATAFACGSISLTCATPCAIVFAVPPVSWMLKVRSSGPSFSASAPKQRADLVRLAAESDDQHAGEVGMARIAAERAAQDRHAVALRVHAAAAAVRQRDHAVDVGKRGERARA